MTIVLSRQLYYIIYFFLFDIFLLIDNKKMIVIKQPFF